MPNSTEAAFYYLLGGGVGCAAAFVSPTTSPIAGVLFGGTFALVSVSTYSLLDCLGSSNLAIITRAALAIFAGTTAGMATTALCGFAITTLDVGSLFLGTLIITLAALSILGNIS